VPDPLEAGDANCDSIVNGADTACLIYYVFKDGTALSRPLGDAPGGGEYRNEKGSFDSRGLRSIGMTGQGGQAERPCHQANCVLTHSFILSELLDNVHQERVGSWNRQ